MVQDVAEESGEEAIVGVVVKLDVAEVAEVVEVGVKRLLTIASPTHQQQSRRGGKRYTGTGAIRSVGSAVRARRAANCDALRSETRLSNKRIVRQA